MALIPMQKIKNKTINYLNSYNVYILCFLVIGILSYIIRIAFFNNESGDFYWYLNPWYESMKESGIQGLGTQVGDYNMLYQFLIYLMTLIPIKPLYVYKLTSVLFDYLLAFTNVKLVSLIFKKSKKIRVYKLLAFTITILSPLVILNSSWWAQCDSMYVFFIMQSIAFLIDESKNNNYAKSFIMLGIAFALKLQTIFILPFYLYIWFRQRKFNIFYLFLLVISTMIASTTPNAIFGRNPFDVFTNYINQTETYKSISSNYPSFWTIVLNPGDERFQEPIKYIGIIFAILILGLIMLYWMYKNIEITHKNMIYMAFILSYTCVLFLPRMHERYGFLYEILALLVYIIAPRTRTLLCLLFFIGLNTYMYFLHGISYDLKLMSLLNVFIWASYLIIITKIMLKKIPTEEQENAKINNHIN